MLLSSFATLHAPASRTYYDRSVRRQVHGHLHHEGFALVAAYAHDAMIGFSYAFPCAPEYWFGSELLPQILEHVRAGP